MSEIFVGIDASKRFHVAFGLGLKGNHPNPYKFSHTEEGFNGLIQWLLQNAPEQFPVFGLEPTEPFSGQLSSWLRAKGHTVHIIPGVYCKRAKFFYTNSGLKSDAVDAEILAKLLRDGQYKTFLAQAEVFQELRELSQQYLRIAVMRRSTLQRLHSLLDHVWPEMTNHIRIQTLTGQQILRRFARPSEVVDMGRVDFKQWIHEVSRGQIKSADALYDSALSTVGRPNESLSLEMQMEVEFYDKLNSRFDLLSETMGGWLEQIDYAPNLLSIPGIGPMAAGMLLGVAGDIRGYATARQLLKTAGLNLVEYSSGQYRSPIRISKQGSKALRRILFSSASVQCSNSKTGSLGEWYRAKVAAGLPRKKIVITAARRMVRTAHALVHHDTFFEQDRYLADACFT